MTTETTDPTLHTNNPQVSESTLATIRKVARQYVHCGGSIFPPNDSDGSEDREERIGMVADALGHRSPCDAFDEALETALPPETHFTQHEALCDAAYATITAVTDAAFMFGAFVALELAGLTCFSSVTDPTVGPTPRG